MTRNTNDIDTIIVHCSATIQGKDIRLSDINEMHKKRRFAKQPFSELHCGYHFIVYLDGTIIKGRDIREVGAHCKGFNTRSIGVCYVGGLDKNRKAKDTRTQKQKESIRKILVELCKQHTIVEICGHREKSPDINGDGKITKDEWLKECPCYNASEEYKDILNHFR